MQDMQCYLTSEIVEAIAKALEQGRAEGRRDALQEVKALIAKWQRLSKEVLDIIDKERAQGLYSGCNEFAFLKASRIYRECADGLHGLTGGSEDGLCAAGPVDDSGDRCVPVAGVGPVLPEAALSDLEARAEQWKTLRMVKGVVHEGEPYTDGEIRRHMQRLAVLSSVDAFLSCQMLGQLLGALRRLREER